MKIRSNYFQSLVHLFFPNICAACGGLLTSSEKVLCLVCETKLPRTNFHRFPVNPTEKVFRGRVPLVQAASFLYYLKYSSTHQLMRLLKYHNRPDIASYLGEYYGKQLITEAPSLTHVDCIVPVPLHPAKLKHRGYNQCEPFAIALGAVLKKPVNTSALIRLHNNKSQTKKGRVGRWENVSQIFQLNERSGLTNKHILLVDDIVTTGATLEACANELLKEKNVQLSILTLAIAP